MRLLTIVLAVVGVAAAGGVASAGKLRVPADYATIQEAVDAAGSGDTIVIKSGTYAERVSIANASRLTLKGSGAPVIDAGGGGFAISVTGSSRVKLQGLVLQGALDGITVSDSEKVLIRDCTIENALRDGLAVDSSQAVKVQRTRIEGAGDDGMQFGEIATRCVVTRNRIGECGQNGIVVLGDQNKLTKNDIADCGEDGIRIWGDDNAAVGNRLARCEDDGVDLWRATGYLLKKNTLSEITENGFQSGGGERNEFVKNTVTGSGFSGFDIDEPGDKLSKNRVTAAGGYGIAFGVGGNVVVGNTIRGSRWFDIIEFEYDPDVVQTPNTYKKNKYETSRLTEHK